MIKKALVILISIFANVTHADPIERRCREIALHLAAVVVDGINTARVNRPRAILEIKQIGKAMLKYNRALNDVANESRASLAACVDRRVKTEVQNRLAQLTEDDAWAVNDYFAELNRQAMYPEASVTSEIRDLVASRSEASLTTARVLVGLSGLVTVAPAVAGWPVANPSPAYYLTMAAATGLAWIIERTLANYGRFHASEVVEPIRGCAKLMLKK